LLYETYNEKINIYKKVKMYDVYVNLSGRRQDMDYNISGTRKVSTIVLCMNDNTKNRVLRRSTNLYQPSYDHKTGT
jgi:hypothetical protein